MSNSENDHNRRPLKTRSSAWVAKGTQLLLRFGATPNGISLLSIAFALLAFAALLTVIHVSVVCKSICLLLAVVGIQGRLLCNLFDGMVAVEGGRKTATGELFNEFPDRIADSLILIATGYSVDLRYGIELGYLAALLAALTAYVRVAGKAVGGSVYFIGPMAKQHRMAILTITFIISSVLVHYSWQPELHFAVLVVINLGCIITLARRTLRIAAELNNKSAKI